MLNKIPPFFLGFVKFVSKYNYKRRLLLWRIKFARKNLKRKEWIKRLIKRNVLIYISVISLTVKSYLETNWRHKAEKQNAEAITLAKVYESQAKYLLRTYDDLGISIFEKQKRGNKFIMIGTNYYYDYQFTRQRGLDGLDYLGKEDSRIHNIKSANDFYLEDIEVTENNLRKWYRGVFIDQNKDTIPIATIKGKRENFKKDTILWGISFDLEKMKNELKLKDQ